MFANQHCVRSEGMRFCTGFCITVGTFNHRYRTIHATSIHPKWKAILVLAPRMTPGILLRVHVLLNLWDMWTGCIFVRKNSHRLWLIIQYRLWNVITGTEAVYTRSIYSQRNLHYYFWVSGSFQCKSGMRDQLLKSISPLQGYISPIGSVIFLPMELVLLLDPPTGFGCAGLSVLLSLRKRCCLLS